MEKKYSMKNFRLTFHDGPGGTYYKSIDILAKDIEDASKIAHEMPEAKDPRYLDILIEKIKVQENKEEIKESSFFKG